MRQWGVLVLVGAVACGASDEGSNGGNGGGNASGNSFKLDYKASSRLLLDVRANADLTFGGTPPNLPSFAAVGVAQARAIVLGNGQQTITFRMSSTTNLEEGDRFGVELEFSRANDGNKLDSGGTLNMACRFYWDTAAGSSLAVVGDCDVRRDRGGFVATVKHGAYKDAELTGTISFGPIVNEVSAFTPNGGCNGQVCVSLNPSEFEPSTGYCLPPNNLKSDAKPCSASCDAQLQIQVGGEKTCVCSAACGQLASGGGDLPVCDPAYGCIDL